MLHLVRTQGVTFFVYWDELKSCFVTCYTLFPPEAQKVHVFLYLYLFSNLSYKV